MDNDNKIKTNDIGHNEVLLFLKDELQPLSHDKPHSYNLEAEYAKTRKNKNKSVWILMACSVVAVILFAFGLSKYVDYTNDNIKVDIDEFNDLNLRNLLDIVSQTKEKYDSALKEKSQLVAQYTYEEQQAEQKRDADLFTLQSLKLNKTETQKRTAAIQKEYKDTIASLHERYDIQISTQENLVNQYQSQLAEYDSNKVTQAQKLEAAVDSQRQLNEIEKAQLVAKYESDIQNLRSEMTSSQQDNLNRQKRAVKEVTNEYQAKIDALDPVLKDDNGILAKANADKGNTSYQGTSMLYQLSGYVSSDFKSAISQASKIMDDFTTAQKVVTGIPQKNSIPAYVNAMSQFSYTALNNVTAASFAEITRLIQINNSNEQLISDAKKENQQKLQKANDEKKVVQSQSDFYQSYFETICQQASMQGMIISLSTTTKVPVYVTQSCRSYFSDPTYAGLPVKGVIMRKNATIAKVTLSTDNGLYYCIPDDVSAGSRIRVSDFLTIDVPTAASNGTPPEK